MKLALGRVASVLIAVSGWLLVGIRVVLDLIGYATVPDDQQVAAGLVRDFLLWLLSVPWWVPWGFALISTVVLILVSWPRQQATVQLDSSGAPALISPAHFKNWDNLNRFPVWQASWLWEGLEPRGDPSEGTPVYSIFQMFKQDLDAGFIPNKQRKDGSWMRTTLTRENLRGYAELKGVRPKFLYPEMRHWWTRFWAWLMKPEDEF